MAPGAGSNSRRAQRREREVALRRSDVLAAAAAEFAHKGFEGAQVADIAAEAEVSLATVYSMFESKEMLFQTVIRTTAEAMRERVQGEVLAIQDSRERILALIDSLFACFHENEDLLRIYARTTHGLPWRIRQSMGESAQELFIGFTQWVIQLAREAAAEGHLGGADPEAFAFSAIGAVTTTAASVAEGTTAKPLPELARDVRTLFARMIGLEPAP